MNNIDWPQVVIDYGKRFPDVTYTEVFGNYCNIHFEDVKLSTFVIQIDTAWGKSLICGEWTYVRTNKRNEFQYYDVVSVNFYEVPDHVKLRLLTEGKEDLV